MSSLRAIVPVEFVSTVAAEVATGVDTAVESWMAQIDAALLDDHLTTLGRINAVREVVQTYKTLTGKSELRCRRASNRVSTASAEDL
jgi:hypothetical protein